MGQSPRRSKGCTVPAILLAFFSFAPPAIAAAGEACADRDELRANLLKAHDCDAKTDPTDRDFCLYDLGYWWLSSRYGCVAQEYMYGSPSEDRAERQIVKLTFAGFPLPDYRHGTGDEIVRFVAPLNKDHDASAAVVPIKAFWKRADTPLRVQVDAFIQSETVAREWTLGNRPLAVPRDAFLADIDRRSPAPEAIIPFLKIEAGETDSSGCPAILERLIALEVVAGPKLDVEGVGEDVNIFATTGRPPDEWPMTISLSIKGRLSSIDVFNADPTGAIYQWGKETFAALEPCWRPTKAQRAPP